MGNSDSKHKNEEESKAEEEELTEIRNHADFNHDAGTLSSKPQAYPHVLVIYEVYIDKGCKKPIILSAKLRDELDAHRKKVGTYDQQKLVMMFRPCMTEVHQRMLK